MAQHSVGLTRKIHSRIKRIKHEHGVTMEGFANIALNSILESERKIDGIVEEIERNGMEKYGAGRLEATGDY